MRIFTHARGVPPKLRATTVRAFSADKEWSSTAGIRDLLSTKNLGLSSASADLADCPVAGARVFDGTNYAFDSAASGDHASLDSECTWQAWVYIEETQVKSSAYIMSYSTTSETSATNILMSMKAQEVSGTLRLRSFWEYGSGVNQEATSTLSPPVNEWCHIAMVREDDPNNVGKCRLRFYINGCQMRDANGDLEFLDNGGSGFEYPSGGSSARWAIANVYNSSTNFFTGKVGPVHICSEALTDAEIQEDYRRGLGWATNNRAYIRVLVEDNFGDMQNLSEVPSPDGDSVDMLQGVRIDDSVDKRVTTATISLFRNHGRINLSPLMSESFLNRESAGSALADRTYPTASNTSYTAPTEADPTTFLNIGRRVQIQMSRMPYGLEPNEVTSFSDTGSDWYDLLVGYVDVVDFGKDVISLNVRDLGALLSDTFIEAMDKTDSKRFVANNTPLNTAIQNIVTNNWTSPFGEPAPTLYEPYTANWVLAEGSIARDLVMGAINKLASQIAWMVRYKWDKGFGTGRQDFRLTLHEPDRDKIIADTFISTDDYVDVSKLSLDISGVRNVVKIAYYGPTFVSSVGRSISNLIDEPASVPTVQNAIEAEDTSSIAKYGRRYMELQENPVDLIDTGNEAGRMVQGILNDLKEPLAHTSLNGKDLVEVELNDMLSIEANNQSFDSDQNYAVSTLNMDVKNGFVDVSFGLRGTPSSGSKRHISMERTSITGPQAPFSEADGTRPTLSEVMNQTRGVASMAAFGGQDPSIANQYFNMWRGGINDSLSEPIGWETSGGTWGSSGDVYVHAIGDGAIPGQTGSFLMDIMTASGGITSDLFPVKTGTPYVAKIRSSVTDTGVTVGGWFHWYDNKKDQNLVTSTAFTAATLSASNIVEEKQFYATSPSSGVAFVKVEVFPDSFVANEHLYLDMVRLTETEPFTRAVPTSDYFISASTSKVFSNYTVVDLGTAELDIGDNFTTGASHYYTAPEDGVYLVNASVAMRISIASVPSGGPNFGNATGLAVNDGGASIISIIKVNSADKLYGNNGQPTRIDTSGSAGLYVSNSTAEGKLKLSKGDVVQLGWAGSIYYASTSDYLQVRANSTFLEVTLLNGEKR